jgi:stage V sporulation protein G
MSVEITDIRVFRVLGSGKVKAYANVTLGGEFAVHGVKVMERDDGTVWVSMPRQRSATDGVWRDVFHPITGEARDRLISMVLKAYEEFLKGGQDTGADGVRGGGGGRA